MCSVHKSFYNSPSRPIISLMLLFLLASCNENQYQLSNGSKVTIPDDNGWVLINFWAPWCHPCIEEIPEINRLANELPTPLVAVYGIYFDPADPEQLKQAIDKYQLKFANFSTEELNLPVTKPSMLPANYLINPDGKVFGPLLGPQTQATILKALTQYKSQID